MAKPEDTLWTSEKSKGTLRISARPKFSQQISQNRKIDLYSFSRLEYTRYALWTGTYCVRYFPLRILSDTSVLYDTIVV